VAKSLDEVMEDAAMENLALFSLFKLGATASRSRPRNESLWEAEMQRATLTPAHFTLH
jgi:hypothetical protein